jgi:voltage-gated potassium channel Kch
VASLQRKPGRALPDVESDRRAGEVRRHLVEMQRLDAELQHARRRRLPWRAWSWILLTAIALSAYGLAAAYGAGSIGARMLDALKLFPSGWPGAVSPWQLGLAKNLAALVSALVTLRVVYALFADRILRLRARLRRGHVVVCGLGEKGRRSARAFRAAGFKVTCVDLTGDGDAADDARRHGALVLEGDATQVVTLVAAAAQRAEHLVAACHDDAANSRIAVLETRLTEHRGRGPANVYAHVANPELARLLRGPAFGLRGARMHFFNVDDVWARTLLEDGASPLARLDAEGAPPLLVVVGGAPLATAVLLSAARRWHAHARAMGSDARLRLVPIHAGASRACEGLIRRYPAMASVCELAPVDVEPSVAHPVDIAPLLEPGRPSAVLVCTTDTGERLGLALLAEQQLPDPSVPILVPAEATAAEVGPLLVGASRVRLVALPHDPDSLDLLHDHRREAVAREVHRAYVDVRRAAADKEERPAERAWPELTEEQRTDNRSHVDAIVEQLQAVWYELEPQYDWDESPVELEPTAVEAMAQLEHARWCADKRRHGWKYGEPRDDGARLHPLLVPWERLPDSERKIDRALVRVRPGALARAGFRLERSPVREELARLGHERYVAQREAIGEQAPLAASWRELPEWARELNRSPIDHIPVKLAAIGCRVAPADGHQPVVCFTPDELERMSRLEHDRWVAERVANGWSPGPRDDEARRHPGLVPYEQLDEPTREKDREQVRLMPELLARAGLEIVRVE